MFIKAIKLDNYDDLVILQVGDTKLYYSFPLSSPYYFSMVVSNGRVPIKKVVAEIEGKDVALRRT